MKKSMHSDRLFKKGQVIELTITDLAFGGVGIAKLETEKGNFAVFVENTIPGQTVRAMVNKCDKRFAECRLLEIIRRSDLEQSTEYQTIPGAPYATLPISLQAEFKRKSVLELFRRIGKVDNIEELMDEYIESPSVWHYRNKMEYSFSAIRFDIDTREELDNDFAFGFKHRGTWWMVENMDKESGMFDAALENSLKDLRLFLQNTGLPAWHPPRREGFFRYFVVRKTFAEDRLLINLVTSSQGLEKFDVPAFAQWITDRLGERVAGLIHTINDDTGDRAEPLSGYSNLLFGDRKIRETIHGLHFDISMQSFFQTNPKCAELLYAKTVAYAQLTPQPPGVIMDLFCGTGTISQLLARLTGQEVIGVDIIEEAIADARENAVRNGINRVQFFAADVGKFLLEYPDYAGKIGTIVLDPPRGGIAPKTLRKVIALNAPRIVYVSCNPSTQARDTETLQQAGYRLITISLVDQFPHTSHVEAVALFEKTELPLLDASYWNQRWEEAKTGWDLGAPTPPIQHYLDQLSSDDRSILIPGAGNGYEAEHLWNRGFRNVFVVDLSPIPLEAFKKRNPSFPSERLICGDFFELQGSFDLIIEHTFFCALSPQLRDNYVKKMAELLAPQGKLVGLLFTRPLTSEGPPFGGSIEEYEERFSPYFDLLQGEITSLSISPRLGNEWFFEFQKKSD
jgi:23S rRNA (uracil-5-)-methyltransferase RumA